MANELLLRPIVKDPLLLVPERIAGPYSNRQVRDGALLLLTGIAVYLCWLLARPFLSGITWALALAVVAYPLHTRIERRFRPNLAALLSVVVIVAVVLAPLAFLIQRAIEEAGGSLGALGQNFGSSHLREMAKRYPAFMSAVDWIAARFNVDQELKRVAGASLSRASAVLGGSIRLATGCVVMLITLFYFLRDHSSLLQYLRRLVPLSQAETDQLFRRMSETIHATLYGNVVVKIVQGTLGGAMFWVLDLRAPVLGGMAMALCAMLPIVGTSFIWGPVAIVLLIQGSWVKAIVLAVWGTFVVGLIDNIIYPFLIANKLRTHTLGVLLSILGGLVAFGVSGVVLGPLILASTAALLEIWRLRAEDDPARSLQCPD